MDSKPLSVLVTGSSGFIGSHVVRQLHSTGHRVTALDLLKPKFPLPDGVEFRQCDIREDHFPNRVFDAVVHLAALAGVRPSMTHPLGYHQTNVNGTLRLLEFCRSMGVPHFVFASSSSVYGPTSPLPFNEDDIDTWLRGFEVSLSSRNSMLVYVKLLFSFALTHNYLPEGKSTAAEQLKKVKAQGAEVEIYTPGQFQQILHAAPPHLIPLLAIGGFTGIRMAELARLDWNASDLDRRHIEVRAGQAKTASRRLIPIPDNLVAWLTPLPRQGKVIASCQFQKEVSALARALEVGDRLPRPAFCFPAGGRPPRARWRGG